MNELQNVQSSQTLTSEGVDESAAKELAAKIDLSSTTAIAAFGRNFHSLTAEYADEMIRTLGNSDTDELRSKLAEVVKAARSFTVSSNDSRISGIPVIGRLTSGLRSGRDKLMTRFSSLERQVDQVLSGIDSSFEKLSEQSATLETMYEGVKEERNALSLYQRACELRLEQLRQELAAAENVGEEQARDQALIENALGKRVADLAVLKHSASQTLPMIRLMAANTAALIDKFHNIKTLTVPSWKRSFAMALSLQDQKNAVVLADTIDDATNHFLMKNAELLRENTTATIRSTQRLAVDVSTLERVHETVVATFADAEQCFAESRHARSQVMSRLQDLGQQLSSETLLTQDRQTSTES